MPTHPLLVGGALPPNPRSIAPAGGRNFKPLLAATEKIFSAKVVVA